MNECSERTATVSRDPEDPRVLLVSIRQQLLWMDFAVASAYFCRYVEPLLRRHALCGVDLRLERVSIERENYHSRIVRYRVRVVRPVVSLESRQLGRLCCYQAKELCILDNDGKCRRTGTVIGSYMSSADRLSTLAAALDATADTTDHQRRLQRATVIPPTTSFDFWQDTDWWSARVAAYWYKHPYRTNDRRVTHMLNQLMRLLRQAYRLDVASALRILCALSARQIDLINSVFVEPINGSLIASHLSTIFMHNKQQTGLNMKHEANKLLTLSTRRLQSPRDFDSKIYLKMCTSCVKRDIFELMIRVDLAVHHANTTDASSLAQSEDDRNAYILCECDSCAALRTYANAWRYYDCDSRAWLRLEFPRKASPLITEILQTETRRNAMQLIFTSDKNEFSDKQLFIDNFVNYYAFYENGQHPLVMSQCSGKLRNTVSVLYIFATVNWVMITDARVRNRNNSISLNQQSLCKSLNNTLYSIFSENCINRVRAEKQRRVIRENAAYINRGLGLVPNTGVNAFNLTHSVDLHATP